MAIDNGKQLDRQEYALVSLYIFNMANRLTHRPPSLCQANRQVDRDVKVLLSFIELFCRQRHAQRDKVPYTLREPYAIPPRRRPLALCADCGRLLAHAIVKRVHCEFDPKPTCKKCPRHCYAPKYRTQIREIMRYSGRRLVLRGRLDYLLHLLF